MVVTVVCILLGLTTPVIWFLGRARENSRLTGEARSKIESLSTRRPLNVPPDQWQRAVDWTSNVVEQIYGFHTSDDPEEIRGLCNSLDQKIRGQVDLATLQWVWEQCEDEEDDRHFPAIRFRDVRLLTEGPISDDRLSELWSLDKCLWLDLIRTQITDEGLQHLRGLSQLKRLDLDFTNVTSQGIKELQEALPNCCIHWTTPPPTPKTNLDQN